MKKPPPIRPRAARSASADSDLARLRAAAAGCHDCDLWRHATQVVFGEGSDDQVTAAGLAIETMMIALV